jgi:chloride channel 7
MMNVRATMEMYPRQDTYYRQKHSLDFDMMRSKIMIERPDNGQENIALWGAHVLCGVLIGVLAFMLTWLEDEITKYRAEGVQYFINLSGDDSLVGSYFFYIGSAVLLVLIATYLTVYIGPGAMGSGVAEVMGMLNGVNYTDAISFKTLFVKCFGTLFAVVGGLCIGKEGPLVHIGSNIGVLSCYAPFAICEYI